MFLEDLKELLKNQDNIIIRIDTRNENRISEREIHLHKVTDAFLRCIEDYPNKIYTLQGNIYHEKLEIFPHPYTYIFYIDDNKSNLSDFCQLFSSYKNMKKVIYKCGEVSLKSLNSILEDESKVNLNIIREICLSSEPKTVEYFSLYYLCCNNQDYLNHELADASLTIDIFKFLTFSKAKFIFVIAQNWNIARISDGCNGMLMY